MIDAEFEGVCGACEKKIHVGDSIEPEPGRRPKQWRHVTCPVATENKPTSFQGTTLDDMGY